MCSLDEMRGKLETAYACSVGAVRAFKLAQRMHALHQADAQRMHALHQYGLMNSRVRLAMAMPSGTVMFVYALPSDRTVYNDESQWPAGLAVAFVRPPGSSPRLSEEGYVQLPRRASVDTLAPTISALSSLASAEMAGGGMVCSICLDKLRSSQASTTCMHCELPLHRTCFDSWSRASASVSCPQCRKPFQARPVG